MEYIVGMINKRMDVLVAEEKKQRAAIDNPKREKTSYVTGWMNGHIDCVKSELDFLKKLLETTFFEAS